MVLDDEEDAVGPLLGESEALDGRNRPDHALVRVIAAEAFADVVEQTAEEEHGPVVHLLHQLRQLRHRLRVLPLPESAELLHEEDREHVDGVRVIDDVLPAADDVLPLGDHPGEDPDVVHRHQRAHHANLGFEDPHDHLRHFGRRAQPLVHQVQILPDQPLGHPGQADLVTLGDLEHAKNPNRVGAQMGRVRNRELVVDQDEAVLDRDRLRLRGLPSTRAPHALVDHQLRMRLDGPRVAIVVAHETLDREVRVVGLESQVRQGRVLGRRLGRGGRDRLRHRSVADALGDLFLGLEAHLIIRAPGP